MSDNNNPWLGRDDSGEQGDTRRLHNIVRVAPDGYGQNDPVLLGFACDAGVIRNHGRPGARKAPAAIRRMLAGLPAHQFDVLWDGGDVACEGDALEAAQEQQGLRVASVLDAGARPVVLGGGHEMAWADFQGLYRHLEQRHGNAVPPILIVNLDAHFDMRTSRPGSSGTPFDQILAFAREHDAPVDYAVFGISMLGNTAGLVQHAKDLGVHYVEDIAMRESYVRERLADLDRLIAKATYVYLTIDTDCMPATVAPGVSAPAALGVPPAMVEMFIRRIKASGKMILADIAEMNPDHDIDNHTARTVARLVWHMLAP